MRRTPAAIGLAALAGVPVGLFLNACASPPFGPVLLGWVVALVVAATITAGLCVLATDHEAMVGVGYAMGVAGSGTVANIVRFGITNDWPGMLGQFAVVFLIMASMSLLGSFPVLALKWEDKRARERRQGGRG